jgi:hypothetical protein
MLAWSCLLSSVNHLEGLSLIQVIIEDGSVRLRSVRTMHSSILDDNDGKDKLARRREFGGGVVGTPPPVVRHTKGWHRRVGIARDRCNFYICNKKYN